MNDTSQRELWSMDSAQLRKESLQILSSAIALLDKDPRMEKLLADFSNDYAKGWDMAVGTYFRDALDIKQTPKVTEESKTVIWTQGGTFAFCQGDILYDTPLAYQEWGSAMKHIGKSYQVTEAIAARPEKQQVFYKKAPAFDGSLKGARARANTSRREAIVNATPTDWIEVENLTARVKDATDAKATPALLDELTTIGALEKKIEIVAPRFPGHIRFHVLLPTPDRSSLHTSEELSMTQDQFVALLITGDSPNS